MSDDLDDIQYSNRRKRAARRISESSSDSDTEFQRTSRKIRKISQAKRLSRRALTSSNSSGVSSEESVVHAPSRATRRLSSDNGNNDSNDSDSESEVIVRTVRKSSGAVIRSEEEDSSWNNSSSTSSSSTSSSSSSSSSNNSTTTNTTSDPDFTFSFTSFNSQMRRTRRTAVPREPLFEPSDDESSPSDSGTSSPILTRARNGRLGIAFVALERINSSYLTRATRAAIVSSSPSSSSSSSDSPIIRPRRTINRTITAVSETSSESSSENDDEEVAENRVNVQNDGSIWEVPDSEDEVKATKKTKPVLPALVSSSSDSDDPTAEPCPICLRKLTTQEIGTPESCDHSFCLSCLQEWAKNVNTCPVDRQQFTMILVRKTGSDKILRVIKVENVEIEVDVVNDPTACEICGESDREDRLMLCDGCNRGYHLDCMTPPLDHVPLEEWFCPDCNVHLLSDEVDDDEEEDEWSINIRASSRAITARYAAGNGRQTRRSRLMPRTGQNERIMSLLGQPTPRTRGARASEASGSGLNSTLEDDGGSQTSRSRSTVGRQSSATAGRQATAATRRKRRRKRKRQTGAFRIKVIQTEEGVIEVSLPRKKRKKRKTKRRRAGGGGPRVAGTAAKTAKERLARRLGICARPQGAPPTRQMPPALSGTQQLSMNRHSAGIPSLDLFGNRNQLDDLLTGSENEDFDEEGSTGLYGGGSVSLGIASRHRVTISASTMSRRKAALLMSRRRIARPASAAAVSASAAPAGGNLLDSILEDQAKWHSRNSEIIHNVSDGSLTVKVQEKGVPSIGGKEGEGKKIDVRNETATVNETPLYPGGNNQRFNYSNNYQQPGASGGGGANNNRNVDNSSAGSSSMNRSFPGSFPQSRSEFSSNYGVGISPFTGSTPIRFRMTAPPRKPTMIIPPLEQPPMPDASLFQNDSASNSSNGDEEVDIYSDIEPERSNGGGAEGDECEKNFGTLEPPPEPPAILMNIGSEDNGASDDEGLVIDDRPPPPPLPPPLPTDDVYDPAEPCDSNSSSDEAGPSKIPYPPLPKTSRPPPPEPDESLLHPNYGMCPTIGLVPSESEDEDADCPNFSMYSSASMTLAQKEDRLEDDEEDVDNDGAAITGSSENLFSVMPDIPLPDDEPQKKQEKKDESDSDGEANDEGDDIEKQLNDMELKTFDQNTMDIPIPADMKEEDIPVPAEIKNDEIPVPDKIDEKNNDEEEEDEILSEGRVEKESDDKSVEGSEESVVRGGGEDEGSTQDVLDLAIESEANLQDAQDDNDDATSISTVEKEVGEVKEKQMDAGEKPDGLIDITDEEMSVYDGPEDNLDKGASEATESKDGGENVEHDVFESDDDNSLIGGATSAVSGGTLNNSDNPQISSLPGLEGLETETISESEDVNFDELPEGVPQDASNEDEYEKSSKKKKKKRNKKSNCISETDESVLLGLKGQLMDMLEFEEGEIIEDKPKQSSKKDKKSKSKHDKDVVEKEKETRKSKTPPIDKDSDKKQKKKKDKKDSGKDKAGESSGGKSKDPKFKEKTAKVGDGDENVSWKKLSKSTKERNYRDGKEKDEKSKAEKEKAAPEPSSKKESSKKKEKRKELERYDVRRLISERPKRPKKDEFGRDISPSPSESLSPPRHRNRSPLRVRNRSRSPWRSRSRSRGRRRTRTPPRPPRQRTRSRSRDRRVTSRDRKRGGGGGRRSRTRSRERVRAKSRERERPQPAPSKAAKKKPPRNDSRSKKKSKSRSPVRAKRVSRERSYSKSWSPSWSRSSPSPSRSRSLSPRQSLSRSASRSWSRDRASLVNVAAHKSNPHKNLTVIVTNKDAMRKKDKKKTTKKTKDQDKQRKRRRGQSPVPSKEVFTSGDNILVSVNFKSNRGTAELVPATTPVLRESSKRKRDDIDPITGRRKKSSKENVPARSKKSQLSKSTRLLRLNETVKNAKPVAVIDLDMSPFREQTPSPKEVIILTDSGGEDNDKEHNDLEKQLERMGEGHEPGRRDIERNELVSQPESPSTHSFLMTSTGPKTPPEPHIKFSIVSNKPQLRTLNNPLMECDDEMRQEEGADEEEIMHKGPNTPPEPPPELNTPASPPTTPYDPFDPTKSRSPSPQPHNDNEAPSKDDKTADNLNATDIEEHAGRSLEHRTPPMDADELKKTPEPLKSLSTPKPETNTEPSPKHQSPSSAVDQSKLPDDNLLKPFQKLLSSQSKVDISVHKSPDKGMTTVIISQQGQQIKSSSLLPSKQITTTSTSSKTVQITASKILSKQTAGPAPYNPLQALNASKSGRAQQNGSNDATDDILELDVGSPYSPGSSEGDDLFDPPPMTPPRTAVPAKPSKRGKNKLDMLFGTPAAKSSRHSKHSSKAKKAGKSKTTKGSAKKEVNVKLDEDQLKILDDLPSSAVEMQVKDKFLKKLNRQERVVEEVKLVLKPHYAKKHIGKEEYKEILRRAVPKICHNRSGEINPMKIQFLVEAYVRKFRKNAGTGGGAPPAAGGGKKKGGGGTGTSAAGGVPLAISIPPKPKIQKTLWS